MRSNNDVVYRWRDGGKNIRSRHVFFEGRTIFSYGHHYPIALLSDYISENKRIVFINSDRYSVTTSHHRSRVLYSLSSEKYMSIFIPTDLLEKLLDSFPKIYSEQKQEIVGYLMKKWNEALAKFRRARKTWSKSWWMECSTITMKQVTILLNIQDK